MRAFAFLGQGATDFLSGLRWPEPSAGEPGAWLEPDTPSPAVRACTAEQLPWWLDRELWATELGGSIEETGRSLLAERGRLLTRVEAWTPSVAQELTEDCQSRLRTLAADALPDREDKLAGFAADAVRFAADASEPARGAAVVAYVAAHVAGGADESLPGYADGFAEERLRQATWLRTRLGL